MTLPTFLTILRIILIPFIVFLMYMNTNESRWFAFALYAIAGITDYFDGYLARTMNTISDLGRFLDPVADKLLVVSILMSLVVLGQDGISVIHSVAGIIIVVREITVSSLREYLAEKNVIVHVSKLAKWKTAFQFLALGFLILGDGATPTMIPSYEIGITLLWTASILTAITGLDYIKKGLVHFK